MSKTVPPLPPLEPISAESGAPGSGAPGAVTGNDVVVTPTPASKVSGSVKQPTKHPTAKVTAVGLGGGAIGTVMAWVQARFGIELLPQDVTIIMAVVTFAAGYFTKDRVSQFIADRG